MNIIFYLCVYREYYSCFDVLNLNVFILFEYRILYMFFIFCVVKKINCKLIILIMLMVSFNGWF